MDTNVGSDTLPPPDKTNLCSLSQPTTHQHLTRFLVMGSASVLTDFGVYWLLGTRAGFSREFGKGLSYLSGVLIGFVGNKYWTFESRRKSWTEPASYLAIYAITLLVNIGVNRLALTWLGADKTLDAFLVATGITTVLNFLGMRFITFRRGINARLEMAAPNKGVTYGALHRSQN